MGWLALTAALFFLWALAADYLDFLSDEDEDKLN